MSEIDGIDIVLFDIGGTLVEEAAPGTPVADLVAQPRPGVLETLQALRPHHRLGAVTDTAVMDEQAVRKLLAPIGIDALLEAVVTSTDVGAAKPDPASIIEALRRFDATPDRALLIGDRSVDRDAASGAGVEFAATDRGVPDAIERARGRRTLPRVSALDTQAAAEAQARQNNLTKPAGALGALESLSVQLAAISGRCPPPIPTSPAVAVFAADHGVVASGVTPWPQDITAQMVGNFAAGGAAINVIARSVGAAVHIVDVGVASDVSHLPEVLVRKVRSGTGDIAHEPAMTTADALRAIEVGADIARTLVADGHDLLVTGEMGIGNTTPSAAVIAALTGATAPEVTGRGTGIDDAMLATKTAVVETSLRRVRGYLDPVSVLSEVGGLEIAALAGFIVGGAAAGVPVLVDGVIACAALLVADALVPGVAARCIAGHRSAEPGASVALTYLGLTPLLDLELRLGEGTGACLAVPLVRAAAAILNEMATFDDLASGAGNTQ